MIAGEVECANRIAIGIVVGENRVGKAIAVRVRGGEGADECIYGTVFLKRKPLVIPERCVVDIGKMEGDHRARCKLTVVGLKSEEVRCCRFKIEVACVIDEKLISFDANRRCSVSVGIHSAGDGKAQAAAIGI